MTGSHTLTIIKPRAVRNQCVGTILAKINEAGFNIVAMKMTQLSLEQAKRFYQVHENRPFYTNLCEFMSSGPIIAAILEKTDAVEAYRQLIGNTNPLEAKDGTIRKLFGESIQENAVHGSDSDENATLESQFFFSEQERI